MVNHLTLMISKVRDEVSENQKHWDVRLTGNLPI